MDDSVICTRVFCGYPLCSCAAVQTSLNSDLRFHSFLHHLKKDDRKIKENPVRVRCAQKVCTGLHTPIFPHVPMGPARPMQCTIVHAVVSPGPPCTRRSLWVFESFRISSLFPKRYGEHSSPSAIAITPVFRAKTPDKIMVPSPPSSQHRPPA